MKLQKTRFDRKAGESLPSLGAWIETGNIPQCVCQETSLPSLGAWIETDVLTLKEVWASGRSLHWERGLKRDYVEPSAVRWVAPFIGSVD